MKKIEKRVKAAEEEFQIAKTKLEEAQAADAEDDVTEKLTKELSDVTDRIRVYTSQMQEARVSGAFVLFTGLELKHRCSGGATRDAGKHTTASRPDCRAR